MNNLHNIRFLSKEAQQRFEDDNYQTYHFDPESGELVQYGDILEVGASTSRLRRFSFIFAGFVITLGVIGLVLVAVL